MQSIEKCLNDKLLNLEETGSVVTTVRDVLKVNIGMPWQDSSTKLYRVAIIKLVSFLAFSSFKLKSKIH